MPVVPKDLKSAILAMPSKKKDKLLLQLLASNQLLQDQLRFELMESADGLETRRATLQQQIESVTKGFYYNASELLAELRLLCPAISYHAKVTQDCYGEVSLWLTLVNGVLEQQRNLVHSLTGANEALALFLSKRTEEAIQKLRKLHPDLHIEFAKDLHEVLKGLHSSAAGYSARKAGLPVGWEE